jgi:hypothetical protein
MVVHRRRYGSKRTIHHKKRAGSVHHRKHHRKHHGKGLTDWIPSVIYDRLPAIDSIPGVNFAKGVKAAYDMTSALGSSYYPSTSSNIENIIPPPPPPLPKYPKGGLPYRKSDIEHNRRIRENIPDPYMESKKMLEQMNERPKPNILKTARKFRPITYIDRLLADAGVREPIRKRLNKSTLGRLAVSAANKAIQLGFGKKHATGRVHHRIHHRIHHRRMGGSKYPSIHGTGEIARLRFN